MTDRISHLTVVLDKSVRDDDPKLKKLMDAIGELKGVSNVEAGVADSFGEHVGETRVRRDIHMELIHLAARVLDDFADGKKS